MLIQLRVRSLAARCWAYLRTHPRRVVLLTVILPATGVFGPTAVHGVLMSAVILGAMAAARGPLPSDAGLILLLALWGPAGIAGLLALWSWALSPPPATRLQLGLTVAGIATGIAALVPWMVPAMRMAPLFSTYVNPFSLWAWFALLLLAVAVAALLDLLVRLSQLRNRGGCGA